MMKNHYINYRPIIILFKRNISEEQLRQAL